MTSFGVFTSLQSLSPRVEGLSIVKTPSGPVEDPAARVLPPAYVEGEPPSGDHGVPDGRIQPHGRTHGRSCRWIERTLPKRGGLAACSATQTTSRRSGRVPPLVTVVEPAHAGQGDDFRGRSRSRRDFAVCGAVTTEPQVATVNVVQVPNTMPTRPRSFGSTTGGTRSSVGTCWCISASIVRPV